MKTCRPDNSLCIITLHFKRLSVLVVKCYFRVGKIMITLDQILNVPRSELKLDVCIPATAKIKLRSRIVGFDLNLYVLTSLITYSTAKESPTSSTSLTPTYSTTLAPTFGVLTQEF